MAILPVLSKYIAFARGMVNQDDVDWRILLYSNQNVPKILLYAILKVPLLLLNHTLLSALFLKESIIILYSGVQYL